MHIFVLTATYELRVSRKSHLRDHPNFNSGARSVIPYKTRLHWDLYFFKLTQPLTVSTVLLLYTVKEKGGKPYPLPYSLRNLHRNLKSENSPDNAQKPQRNCTFMNSASSYSVWKIDLILRSIQRRPQMQFSIERKFTLKHYADMT